MNPLLLTDSYKVGHHAQYPPMTTRVYSYFESRGGAFPETVFVLLQYLLARYLAGEFVSRQDVHDAELLMREHFGRDGMMHADGWRHVVSAHGGRLPLRIKAVPEGTVVPTSNVLMTVENTCDQCYWLTNWIETLLVQTWYPTTVATMSRAARKVILHYLELTGDPAGIDYKLHDFGYRGVSSVESAAIGGAAHLVNFLGTDTLAALDIWRRYYGGQCAGYSIPASEHSTITSWGKDGELAAYANMLDQYPSGLVACVSDSYDILRACRELWGGALKDRVLAREGTLVIRPDSGDPVETVVAVVHELGKAFGYTTNAKGYRVLDPHVRVIQGDGLDLASMTACLHRLAMFGWSADNVAFGMGGGLLQKVNRDTQKFAFKCSSVTVDGARRDVYKSPVGDRGKASKRGRLKLVRDGSSFKTVGAGDIGDDQLVEVFRDGEIVKAWTLTEVRARARA